MNKNSAIITVLAIVLIGGVLFLSRDMLWTNAEINPGNNNPPAGEDLNNEPEVVKPANLISEEEWINAKRDQYIKEGKAFIWADLETLDVYMYQANGEPIKIKAKTKGREGRWWETPSGEYTILGKNPTGYSSLGGVYMPYAMQFNGNFLFHGWPYYPNGEDVGSSYSGGCIRFTNDNAMRLYNFATVGMPVLIIGERDTDNYLALEAANGSSRAPEIAAESFLVTHLNGEVLADKDSNKVLPVGALTNFITALTAAETFNMDRAIGSGTIFDNLYPMFMQSSKRAADGIAGFAGRSYFVTLMQRKANSMGMTNTKVVDSSGTSLENVSTARDLGLMARYTFEKRFFIYKITKGDNNLDWGYSSFGEIENYNDFVDDPLVFGAKTGKSPDGKEFSLVLLNFEKDGKSAPILIVVLGSSNQKQDTQALIDWVKGNFSISSSGTQ